MKKDRKQTESLAAVHTHTHTHEHSKQRGITLIALVVTIVVLLILAGVSINLVLGNNGIITKAKESRTETRMSQIDEQVKLAIGDAYTEGLGSITDSGLKSALNNHIGEGTYDITGDETTGWKVTVKETGKTCPAEILEAIASINAEGRPVWKPMHMQPVYKNHDFIMAENRPVSEDIFAKGICLPSDNKMTEQQQDIVIEIVKELLCGF